MVNAWGVAFGNPSAWGGSFGSTAAAAATGMQVVLFPPEPLRFRSRWDKTAYAWGVFMRDMRAPTAGYRPGQDHYVSAVALAAR